LEKRKLLISKWDMEGPRPRRIYQLTGLAEKLMSEPSAVPVLTAIL